MNINKHNYEEWMVDHLEGNLSPSQEAELEQFLQQNPDLRSELEMFSNTILVADKAVVFPDKELLRRKETRIIGMRTYFRYATAIAATLLLFIAIRSFINNAETISGNNYTSEIEKPVLHQKATDRTDAKEESTNTFSTENDIFFAEDKKDKVLKNNFEKENVQPLQTIRMEQNYAVAFQLSETASLKVNKTNPKLKVPDFKEQYAALYRYHFDNMMKPTQQQPSLVDRLNNTMALANDFGNMLGLSRTDKSNQTENTDEQKVKTTSIKILDLEFYNRRKVNQ